MGRPRKDRGPPNVGDLQPLKTSVFKEDAAPVEEEDDDMMDEEAILSQQSTRERVFGENGLAKLKETAAAAASAASSSRPRPTPRKRKSASPSTASRQSKRIATMSRPVYKDPVGNSGLEPPEPPNSDDDFQTDFRTPKKDEGVKKRRGRPPKRRRDSEPANASSQSGRAASSQESVFGAGGSSQGSNGQRPRLQINFSPMRASKPTSRQVTEKQLNEWKRARQTIAFYGGEKTIIMNAFRDNVLTPPTTAEKMEWYEKRFGRPPTIEELDEVNKEYFLPWSEEWFDKKDEYHKFCEARKREKPYDKDPAVTERDAKRWIKEYIKQYGTLEQPEIPHKYRTPSKRRRLGRSRAEDVIEPQANAAAASEPSTDVTLDGRTTDVVDTAKRNDDVVDVDAMAAVGETGKNVDGVDVDLDDADTKNRDVEGNQEMEGALADADVGKKKLKTQMTVDLTEHAEEQPRSSNTSQKILGFSINLNERDGFSFDDTRSTLHLIK